MEVVFNEDDLRAYMGNAVQVSNDSPVLLDRFLDVAIEVDVDAVCDGEDVLIGGIMEHIEHAGVQSVHSALLDALHDAAGQHMLAVARSAEHKSELQTRTAHVCPPIPTRRKR